MNAESVEYQIQDVLDGSAGAADRAALRAVLTEDPEACRLYLDYVYMGLAMECTRAETVQKSFDNVVPMDRILARQKRRAFRLAGIAAAAAVAAAVVASVLVVLPDAPVARFKVSPKTEFTLTHAVRDGERAPEGLVVEVGSRLRVERGTVELAFASGVKGVVRGPADFTLREGDLVDLVSGIAWFEVPPEAVGFQVDTPDFQLTDLGTEFGVVSQSGAVDEVHVFTGEVEVRHHRGRGGSVVVTEGQARAANDEGGWEDIEYSPGLFATYLPTDDPAPPYLHWSFDGFVGDSLPVDGTHPAVDGISSVRGFPNEGPEVIEGVHGGALDFDRMMDHIKTDWAGIGGRGARSVAFWFNCSLRPRGEGEQYRATLITWGDAPMEGPNTSWAVRANSGEDMVREDLRGELRGRTLLQVWTGSNWINGSTDLADGKWHHLAVCYDGKVDSQGRPSVQLYVDGVYEPSHHYGIVPPGAKPPPVDTRVGGPASNPLLIGRSKHSPAGSCDAALDELYIFDGYLDPGLVYSLAHAREGWRP